MFNVRNKGWTGLLACVWLLLACPTAPALTLKTAPEILAALEQSYQEVQKELSVLEKELPNVIRKGATLKERGDYIRAVLELRKKLQKIEAERAGLTGKVQRLPHAPPLLKLVGIEADLGAGAQVSGAGWVVRTAADINIMGRLGCCDPGELNIIRSFRVTQAPLMIRPTEPFSISIEAKERRFYPDEHICYDCSIVDPQKRREDRRRTQEQGAGSFVSARISSGEIFALMTGERDLESYVDEGGVGLATGLGDSWYYKGATTKSDAVNLTVRFIPKDQRVDHLGDQEYYYDASASGGRKVKLDVKTQYPFYRFNLPTDQRGYLLPDVDTFGGTGLEGITVYVGGETGGLKLRYEPVRPDDPALSSLSIPEHPAELAGDDVEGAMGTAHIVPDVVGMTTADAKGELKERGLEARLGPGTPATSPEESDTVEKQSPDPGTRMDAGGTVSLNIRSPFVELRTLPDVRRQSYDAAAQVLRSAGFTKVTRSEGSPAGTPDEHNTVEKQLPETGSRAQLDTEVILTVFTDAARERRVPNVTGLSTADAKAELARAGFTGQDVLLRPGGPAPSQDKSGTVEAQDPLPNAAVTGAGKVTLMVHSAYVAMIDVPDVAGMTYPDAKKILARSGLFIDQRGAGRPPSGAFSKKVQRQDPQPPARLRENATVIVWVYDEHRATPQELVAGLDCSGFANSHPDWNRETGRPECFCNSNHRWNTTGTACIPIPGTPGGPPAPSRESAACPGAIYAIKFQREQGADAAYLQMLARNAQAQGCQDPVIDQVLSTGTATGTGAGPGPGEPSGTGGPDGPASTGEGEGEGCAPPAVWDGTCCRCPPRDGETRGLCEMFGQGCGY